VILDVVGPKQLLVSIHQNSALLNHNVFGGTWRVIAEKRDSLVLDP
jgi:hypothetical protein